MISDHPQENANGGRRRAPPRPWLRTTRTGCKELVLAATRCPFATDLTTQSLGFFVDLAAIDHVLGHIPKSLVTRSCSSCLSVLLSSRTRSSKGFSDSCTETESHRLMRNNLGISSHHGESNCSRSSVQREGRRADTYPNRGGCSLLVRATSQLTMRRVHAADRSYSAADSLESSDIK